MSYFLNAIPQNNEFTFVYKEAYFVDKTNMLDITNSHINKKERFICITRPRRFGKSVNALMLASYYANNLDMHDIFDNLNISKCASYKDHLNKHNVIYIVFTQNADEFTSLDEYIDYFKNNLKRSLLDSWPDIPQDMFVTDMFKFVYEKKGISFIFIMDEWDYIFDTNFSDKDKQKFTHFLTSLLKDQPYVELAYMTGILPIAKHSSRSPLNMFREYSALKDDTFDQYFGFTQSEVESLCAMQDKISSHELEVWYNGYYTFFGDKIYNPRSVVYALSSGRCDSYWTNTGKIDDIVECVQNNIDSVKSDILKMLDGEIIHIDLPLFATERMLLDTREHILSAMVVLGFLSYYDNKLSIPNKELKLKFADALTNRIFGSLGKVMQNSNRLLYATLEKDTKTMSTLLREAHSLYTSILTYNDENSLACVIQLAYISALKRYEISREKKAGDGIVDFAFIPYKKSDPAFIMELKVDKKPEEAVAQISNKNYSQALYNCTGEKLAVVIAYNKDNTNHDDNKHHYIRIYNLA